MNDDEFDKFVDEKEQLKNKIIKDHRRKGKILIKKNILDKRKNDTDDIKYPILPIGKILKSDIKNITQNINKIRETSLNSKKLGQYAKTEHRADLLSELKNEFVMENEYENREVMQTLKKEMNANTIYCIYTALYNSQTIVSVKQYTSFFLHNNKNSIYDALFSYTNAYSPVVYYEILRNIRIYNSQPYPKTLPNINLEDELATIYFRMSPNSQFILQYLKIGIDEDDLKNVSEKEKIEYINILRQFYKQQLEDDNADVNTFMENYMKKFNKQKIEIPNEDKELKKLPNEIITKKPILKEKKITKSRLKEILTAMKKKPQVNKEIRNQEIQKMRDIVTDYWFNAKEPLEFSFETRQIYDKLNKKLTNKFNKRDDDIMTRHLQHINKYKKEYEDNPTGRTFDAYKYEVKLAKKLYEKINVDKNFDRLDPSKYIDKRLKEERDIRELYHKKSEEKEKEWKKIRDKEREEKERKITKTMLTEILTKMKRKKIVPPPRGIRPINIEKVLPPKERKITKTMLTEILTKMKKKKIQPPQRGIRPVVNIEKPDEQKILLSIPDIYIKEKIMNTKASNNDWIDAIKMYQNKTGVSYKEAMQEVAKTYVKKGNVTIKKKKMIKKTKRIIEKPKEEKKCINTPYIDYVKYYQQLNGLTWREAMKQASESYKKIDKLETINNTKTCNIPYIDHVKTVVRVEDIPYKEAMVSASKTYKPKKKKGKIIVKKTEKMPFSVLKKSATSINIEPPEIKILPKTKPIDKLKFSLKEYKQLLKKQKTYTPVTLTKPEIIQPISSEEYTIYNINKYYENQMEMKNKEKEMKDYYASKLKQMPKNKKLDKLTINNMNTLFNLTQKTKPKKIDKTRINNLNALFNKKSEMKKVKVNKLDKNLINMYRDLYKKKGALKKINKIDMDKINKLQILINNRVVPKPQPTPQYINQDLLEKQDEQFTEHDGLTEPEEDNDFIDYQN